MVELHGGAATDVGLVRATNQDAFLAAAPVFVVEEFARIAADGYDAADRIVGAALAAGGEDNATAVVVDVVGLTETALPEEMRSAPVSLEEKLGALP